MNTPKHQLIASALLLLCASLNAGNLGPGPWANGAYFQGQYDGIYTASIFGGSPGVVSGVLGFGLRNGAPSTSTSTNTSTTQGFLTASTSSSSSVAVDPNQNYYVVYVDGQSYSGTTIANVNQNSRQVSGALVTGTGSPTTEILVSTNTEISNSGGTVVTNTTESFTTVTLENTCGGGFSANIGSDEAVISFKGDNTGILATSENGIPTETNTFSVNGTRVGN